MSYSFKMLTAPAGAAFRHSRHRTHSSRFSCTISSFRRRRRRRCRPGRPRRACAASSASRATASSTSTAMNERLAHGRSPGDPLVATIPGICEISSATTIPASARRAIFSRGGVLLALDDRAGVAEAHAGHLVHEASGHERDDRQARVVLGHPARELGLHAPSGLGVDDDRPGSARRPRTAASARRSWSR